MVFATREALEDELGRLSTENAALLADLEAAKQREKALVEGLLPFASLGRYLPDTLEDWKTVWEVVTPSGTMFVTVGHARRAAALLAPQPAEPLEGGSR